jgi:diaminopimelate decarboxylase/aspartate kinase
MNALLRPALYGAFHGVHNLSRDGDAGRCMVDVVGPICESGDVLAQERELPADTAEGDVLLVADTGAYGMSMASGYNLRDLPGEIIIDDAATSVAGTHEDAIHG